MKKNTRTTLLASIAFCLLLLASSYLLKGTDAAYWANTGITAAWIFIVFRNRKERKSKYCIQ